MEGRHSTDLVPVIEGELMDDLCSCGRPGRLVPNPYVQDVCDEYVLEVMCDDCEEQAALDV